MHPAAIIVHAVGLLRSVELHSKSATPSALFQKARELRKFACLAESLAEKPFERDTTLRACFSMPLRGYASMLEQMGEGMLEPNKNLRA